MFNNDLEDVGKHVRRTARMYLIKSISLDEVEVRLDGILQSSAKVYGADPAEYESPRMRTASPVMNSRPVMSKDDLRVAMLVSPHFHETGSGGSRRSDSLVPAAPYA